MSDRVLVATRKGLFDFRRVSAGGVSTWEHAGVSFVGEPVTIVLPDDRDGTIYAALNLGHFGVKLHRSFDGGTSFEEIAVPRYPEKPAGSDDPTPWSLRTRPTSRPEPKDRSHREQERCTSARPACRSRDRRR